MTKARQNQSGPETGPSLAPRASLSTVHRLVEPHVHQPMDPSVHQPVEPSVQHPLNPVEGFCPDHHDLYRHAREDEDLAGNKNSSSGD